MSLFDCLFRMISFALRESSHGQRYLYEHESKRHIEEQAKCNEFDSTSLSSIPLFISHRK